LAQIAIIRPMAKVRILQKAANSLARRSLVPTSAIRRDDRDFRPGVPTQASAKSRTLRKRPACSGVQLDYEAASNRSSIIGWSGGDRSSVIAITMGRMVCEAFSHRHEIRILLMEMEAQEDDPLSCIDGVVNVSDELFVLNLLIERFYFFG
jgi:hypothetical protein